MATNDLGAILKRIDKRLKVVQLSDRAASLAAGMSADAIRTMRRQWENYKKDLSGPKQKTATAHTLSLLARPLQTTGEWLMNEIGAEDARDARVQTARGHAAKNEFRLKRQRGLEISGGLRVSGEVAAGTWRESPDGAEGFGEISIPAHAGYPLKQQLAFVVHDNTVNRTAQYGDFLIVLDAEASAPPQHNDLVVISRKKADLYEISAKRFCVSENEKMVELRNDSLDPQLSNTVAATLPLRATGIGTKSDNTEVTIKGIVLGVYRQLMR